ncbi:uncharacterized protein BN744_01508 [Bacteroides sp. CAG:633]|nr:uncharacterized protein BN744_01508 [Bacteroides sp. CAG:633]
MAATADGAVQDESHILVLLFVVDTLQLGKHAAFQQTGAYDKEGTVGQLLDDLRIGYHLDRRTVDKYIVVLAADGIDELLEAVAEQQFGGVGRDGAYREELQVGVAGIGDDDVLQVVDMAAQVVAQTGLRRADVGRGRTVAHVTVDDQHFFLLDGQTDRNVHGQERLAAAGIE